MKRRPSGFRSPNIARANRSFTTWAAEIVGLEVEVCQWLDRLKILETWRAFRTLNTITLERQMPTIVPRTNGTLSGVYFTALAPAWAQTASWSDAATETPMAPTIWLL